MGLSASATEEVALDDVHLPGIGHPVREDAVDLAIDVDPVATRQDRQAGDIADEGPARRCCRQRSVVFVAESWVRLLCDRTLLGAAGNLSHEPALLSG